MKATFALPRPIVNYVLDVLTFTNSANEIATLKTSTAPPDWQIQFFPCYFRDGQYGAHLMPIAHTSPLKMFRWQPGRFRVRSVEYFLIVQFDTTAVASRFRHRFQSPVELHRWQLKSARKMFDEFPLDELMREKKFAGLKGLQFVA
jgi:hypothetical protein